MAPSSPAPWAKDGRLADGKIAIPLLGTALAIAPCFKMRFWNIGAEGRSPRGLWRPATLPLFWYDKPALSPVLLAVMAASGACSAACGP